MAKKIAIFIVVFALFQLPLLHSKAATQDPTFRIMTKSDSGDYIGQNKSWDFSDSNNSKVTVVSANDSAVSFGSDSFGVSNLTFDFASIPGKTLSKGLHTPAKRLSFRDAFDGMDVSGDGRGCNTILGAFYVHEYVMSTGTLQKAAIDFVQICEPRSNDINSGSPRLVGSIRYNSTVPDSCNSQGCADAEKNLGITAASAPTFRIMTKSDAGDYIGQGKPWDFSNSNNSKLVVSNPSDSTVSFDVNSFNISYLNFDFASESGKTLSKGLHSPAKRLPFRNSFNGIEISGDGKGCNTILGGYYVHEYSASNGILQKAAIDFVQICDPASTDINSGAPKLVGSLRYNSTIPDSCDSQGCSEAEKNLGVVPVAQKPDIFAKSANVLVGADNASRFEIVDGAEFKTGQLYTISSVYGVSNNVEDLSNKFSGTFQAINMATGVVEAKQENLGAGSLNEGIEPFSWTPTTAGRYKLRFIQDSKLQIAESDENNNTFEKVVTVNASAAALPDLILDSVDLRYNQSLNKVEAVATIKNIGTGDAYSVASFVGLRTHTNNGLELFNWKSMDVGSNRLFLKAGQTKIVNFDISGTEFKQNSDNKFDFYLDRNNAPKNEYSDGFVYESNETNNVFTKTLYIGEIKALGLSEIIGVKDKYYSGEKVAIKIKGLDSNGEPTTVAKGFAAVIRTYKNGVPMTDEGTAYGNNSNGYWNFDYIAPKSVGDYYMVITHWCSYERSFCWNSKLDNNQIDKKYNFSVVEGLRTNEQTTSQPSQVKPIQGGQYTADFNANAKSLRDNKFDELLTQIKQLRDEVKEQKNEIRYLTSLVKGAPVIAEQAKDAINNFITYGVDANTQKIGEKDRAAVVADYKEAFKKLPDDEKELADLIRIADGIAPVEKNVKAEQAAKEQFLKIYKRVPDMNDANDAKAVRVMAYGVRQQANQKNPKAEQSAVVKFKSIHKHTPVSSDDWSEVRAIAYSGAVNKLDSDKDGLADDYEKKLGTNPRKADTDGDGFKDGTEVMKGFNPLKKQK